MKDENSTREEILTAAKKLFAENGYHKTSMSAIAEQTGFSKGTLYWHFDSKDQLFLEIIHKEGEIVKEELKKVRNRNLVPEEILKVFLRQRMMRMLNNKKLTRMFLNSENYINTDFMDAILSLRSVILVELEKIIEKGVEDGLFRPHNVKQSAVIINGMVHNLSFDMVLNDNDQLEEGVKFLLDMIINGLKIKKGGKCESEIE